MASVTGSAGHTLQSTAGNDELPITQDALELRLQPAPTFTATSCPHCDNVFEVQIDFEEIKDNIEFERLKKKELEAQKEAYKQEITRFQEEVNSLKETLANLCNQLAQAQVENLRGKQAAIEQDNYIKQLKDHLKHSEEELHHLAHDFELALAKNKELQHAHLRNTGQVPPQTFSSATAKKITGGETVPGPALGTGGGTGGAPPPTNLSFTTSTAASPTAAAAPPAQHIPSQTRHGQYAPPSMTTPSGPQPDRQEKYRQQLLEFYSIHNPSKMGEVDNILRQFAGHEEDMMVMLARKYCTSPIQRPAGQRPSGYSAAASPYSDRYSQSSLSAPEDDLQLRQVAPWTLQMRNAKRTSGGM